MTHLSARIGPIIHITGLAGVIINVIMIRSGTTDSPKCKKPHQLVSWVHLFLRIPYTLLCQLDGM